MKKFLIVCAILFIASVGCKKEDIGGTGLCACSPARGPELNLVIKNSAGDDLLNDKTAGAYSKDKIELYRKDSDGNMVPVNFGIRPPFSYGSEKFNYNLLYVSVSFSKNPADNSLYLKLGGDKLYEFNFSLNQGKYDVDKLLIDNKEAERDNSNLAKYLTVFYLTQ